VMVAESGARLMDEETRLALIERLLPLATVVTPNLPEARALTDGDEAATQEELARAVVSLGARATVVTGGHSAEIVDVFCSGGELVEIPGARHPGAAAHGSGCTHSSTLAAFLALGRDPLEAARRAREITSDAVRDGLSGIGSGPGPVDVFGLAAGDAGSS
jgi:hydroxymethylpyrimidine/phosphomethylpyrimidine kinase